MATPTMGGSSSELHRVATHKAMLRLIPLMCAIYFMSYLDRTNVSLAKARLAADLGISAAAYGLGAGIFFIGYALLEVPSNLAAHRVGPRRWIARIAVTWGALSAAMMFVQGEWSFYTIRVLLGVAEAGLFPALMYMVTLWFAPKDRSVAVGWIYVAPALALVIGNPVGGAFMQMDGFAGLHGWQWLFLLEGLPTIVVGVILWFKLPEKPSDARWLSNDEARILEARAIPDAAHASIFSDDWVAALKSPATVLTGLIYFLNQVAFVGLVFFTPAMIQQMHVKSPLMIGVLSSSVGIGFLLGVLILPRIHRRVTHDCIYLAVLTAGLIVSAILFISSDWLPVQLALFVATAFFAGGVLPLYWAISMKRLHGIQAAAGLAFINTLGLTGGFVGPYLFGLAESASGKSASGFSVIVGASVLGLIIVPMLAKAIQSEGRTASLSEPLLNVEQ
ncbi:MFS transporter [Paraburkholderia phenazinium]|jgi:MFS family permease|uniref:Sugar phosphate permease n=1 Tax=Paraburkholderia phenazinium TaxID=60549 RepID=A0A1N6JU25_9BURK|nr:MFS transporter [Paraburkholderia phenazinium]SIO47566.1 Sugar phosphate permease [Paraburkholderia phenazinium]